MNGQLDAESSTPLDDGYFVPAEWEAHRRTWMCWPARAECFGGVDGLLRAKQAYARVARAISAFEPVVVAARSAETTEARLATGGKVDIVEMPLDDAWARDFGPTFLKSRKGGLSGIQFVFNAWGKKYHPYTNDANFAARVLTWMGLKTYRAPFVCEGGAVHVDGAGTVLTTEQCLLNVNRNPGLPMEVVEDLLKSYLGARKVIWLGSGFSDDETDGHIDNIACFVGPGKVILGQPERGHPDYEPIKEASFRLRSAHDAEGRSIEVIPIPQPQKLRQARSGRILPASYVNFYLTNGAVMVPAFDDPHDEIAGTILAQCFPGRDLLQIDALDIIRGGGGIHCITQQQPEA